MLRAPVWQLTLVLSFVGACNDDHTLAGPNDAREDAGAEASPDAGPLTPYVLCDGSDGVRFALTSSGGGPLIEVYRDTNPYGFGILYITGKCEYLAGEDRVGHLVTGTLTAERASALEQELELARLSTFRREEGVGCDDGGYTLLATQAGWGLCDCGCDDQTELDRIMQAAGDTQRALEAEGTPLAGDIEVGGFVAEHYDAVTYHPWPLALDLAPLAITREAFTSSTPLPVARVTGADADAMRTLRMTEPERGRRLSRFVEQDGAYYELFLLDVVPDRFAPAIAAFERTPRP